MKNLVKRFKAKTPIYARILQALSGSIAALPFYYSSLPDEWKTTLPTSVIGYVTLFGLFITFLLNLLVKKK